MNGQESRSKALKIVVRVPGVESAAWKGQDKDQIEVVKLAVLLRKNVGYAELVNVKEVPTKKDGGGGGGGGGGGRGGGGGDTTRGETTKQPLPWAQMLPRHPVYQVTGPAQPRLRPRRLQEEVEHHGYVSLFFPNVNCAMEKQLC